MTVAELIDELRKYPSDIDVYVMTGDDGDIPCDPDPHLASGTGIFEPGVYL